MLDRAERFVIRSTGKRSIIDRRGLCGTVTEVAGHWLVVIDGFSEERLTLLAAILQRELTFGWEG